MFDSARISCVTFGSNVTHVKPKAVSLCDELLGKAGSYRLPPGGHEGMPPGRVLALPGSRGRGRSRLGQCADLLGFAGNNPFEPELAEQHRKKRIATRLRSFRAPVPALARGEQLPSRDRMNRSDPPYPPSHPCSFLRLPLSDATRSEAHLRAVSQRSLPVEPDRRQILVDIKARAGLPAFEVRAVGHDAVLPQHEQLMGLLVEHVFLEIAEQDALPCQIGLVQYLLIEIDFVLVFKISLIFGEDRTR